MSRKSTRRRRGYQPYPERRANWGARLLVVFVAFVMIVGFAILTFATR
jgi:beta-lactamase regulating signal transducer with metallopeptidase domain